MSAHFVRKSAQLPTTAAPAPPAASPAVACACQPAAHSLPGPASRAPQIEHHFAPRLSPENLSVVAPEVKAFCGRHNIPYSESGFWIAACHTFGGLRNTAHEELGRRAAKKST